MQIEAPPECLVSALLLCRHLQQWNISGGQEKFLAPEFPSTGQCPWLSEWRGKRGAAAPSRLLSPGVQPRSPGSLSTVPRPLMRRREGPGSPMEGAWEPGGQSLLSSSWKARQARVRPGQRPSPEPATPVQSLGLRPLTPVVFRGQSRGGLPGSSRPVGPGITEAGVGLPLLDSLGNVPPCYRQSWEPLPKLSSPREAACDVRSGMGDRME